MQENPTSVSSQTSTATQAPQAAPSPADGKKISSFEKIRQISSWVMIISAVLFALIGVLATWNAFTTSTGEVLWRSFTSLGIIGFASLVANVAARTAEGKQ